MESKKNKLKIVFMGTSDLSETILKSLLEKQYNVVGVFTKPDTKVGRKQEIEEPLVKKIADAQKIPVFQPERFNAEAIEELRKMKPDLVIVAAYGKIIPKEALKVPDFGCINVHVSLLPKYRGPSPVQNAILNGEKETGVTIMLMDEGVDTGDILAQKKITIGEDDTTGTLMLKLASEGSELLAETITQWIERKLEPIRQDDLQATQCQLIEREDGHVFWQNDAQTIYNQYRAMFPWPGIFSYWKNGEETIRIKLIFISMLEKDPGLGKKNEGEVLRISESEIGVQTADGIILLQELQREGKSAMPASTFLSGYPAFIGSILF